MEDVDERGAAAFCECDALFDNGYVAIRPEPNYLKVQQSLCQYIKMPYRRSIWIFNEKYAPPPENAADVDFQLIGLLQSIEAAKKRTPPIPIARLPELAEKLKCPPEQITLNAAGFADYLNNLLVYGVGIKTAVCMLAVVSGGAFAPMDDKLAEGLLKLGVITPDDAKALNGVNVQNFAAVYVGKVMPPWRNARSTDETPEEIDKRWAQAGEEHKP